MLWILGWATAVETAHEDDDWWALVTSAWDEDDTPLEGQIRKLP